MKRYEDFVEEASKYKQILINYRDKGQVFTDNSFHPKGKVRETLYDFSDPKCEWVRIDDVYKVPLFKKELIDPDFIQQGALGDCYFLTSLTYIARQSELVRYLFDIETPESILGIEKDSINLKSGAVVIYFNVFGRRTPVLIDTYILLYKGRRKPQFSRPADINQSPWFCLVEKAFAKLHGSFSNIYAGHQGDVIYALLGYYRDYQWFKDIKGDKFETLLNNQNAFVIMGTSSQEGYLVDVTPEDVSDKGIVLDHAYSILKVQKCQGKNFICLRNPWGNDQEWLGDYSDTSSLWTPQLQKELKMKPSDDGTFWMIDRDFFKYFSYLDYSKPIPPNWIKRKFFYQFVPGPHDGYNPKCKEAKISEHPNYAFQIIDPIPSGKKVIVRFVIERKNPLGRNKNNVYQVVFDESEGKKFTAEIVPYKNRVCTRNDIYSFAYQIDSNDKIYTIALQRTTKCDVTEDCYVQVFCELDFKLYNIDKPRELIPKSENTIYIIDAYKDNSDDEIINNNQNEIEQEQEQESGLNYYKKQAEKGDVNSMYNCAEILFYGDDVKEDKKEANKYYKMAADNGHVKSMHKYAWNLELGDGIAINKKEALKYYKLAAEKGNVKSMVKCAEMMSYGQGVPAKRKLAMKYYKMAAKNGNVYSMFTCGILYATGDDDIPENLKLAAKYYKMGANKGDVECMFRYAELIKEGGDDLDADEKMAAKYFKMAADKGHVESMKNLAEMFEDGIGVDENKEEAAKYYSKAADEGDVQSMFYAAVLYDDEDEGSLYNVRKAAKYYKMAADKGHKESMYFYGLKLKEGEGVGIDEAESIKYIKKSADKGYSKAIEYLKKSGISK